MRRWYIPCCTLVLTTLATFAGCSSTNSGDTDPDTDTDTDGESGSSGRSGNGGKSGGSARSGGGGGTSAKSGGSGGSAKSGGSGGNTGKSGGSTGKSGGSGGRTDGGVSDATRDGAVSDAARDSARPDSSREAGAGRNGCPIAEGMISDFEEGAPPAALLGLDSDWGIFNDKSNTSQKLALVSTGTEACKKQALNTKGAGYTSWGAGMALTLDMPATAEVPAVVDWSGWKGITFKAKGSAATKSVRFDLVTKWSDDLHGLCRTDLPDTDPDPNKCYNHLGTWISDLSASEFKTYTFCFNDMVPSWMPSNVTAAQRADIAKNIDKLQFQFKTPPVGANPDKTSPDFDFTVDDIQLLKSDAACQTKATPTGSPAPKFPFPQNKKFSGCTQPLGWDQFNGAIVRAYQAWKARYVVPAGNGFRVQRPENNNDSVSEGIAYGMMISVYMGDKTLFDGLWAYAKSFGAGTGFMAWHASWGDSGGATDADEDMAFALIQADQQWGGYSADAKGLIGRILASEVEAGTNVIKGGNLFTNSGSNYTNPSYFAPAFYKTFAKYTGEARWNAVATKAYEVLNTCTQGRANGLVPDWCNATNGNPERPQGTVINQIRFGFDAVRTPWRIGTDACWTGDAAAKAYLAKISGFFSGVTVPKVYNGYNLDGTRADPSELGSMAYVGLTGAGAMGSTNAGHAGYRDDAFRNVLDMQTMPMFSDGHYYETTLGLISLLTMSGNFVDFTQ